jgi:predicted HAD superfamily phosphohydrolase YqeG
MTRICAVESVLDVPFDLLHQEGTVHVVCDIESTLTPYSDTAVDPETLIYLTRARDVGHIASLSLLSDIGEESRVAAVAEQLGGVPYYFAGSWTEWKPNPKNLRAAIRNAGAEPGNTAIIGDRFTSEVLAAMFVRLSRAYWVTPLGEADRWDNIRIWRPVEGLIRPFISKKPI